MEKNDRKLLNDRFKEVFAILEESGEVVRSDRKRNLSIFAERVLGNRQYGHLVSKYLNGERLIKYEYAKRFCDEYDVSETYMFQGKGKPFMHTEKYTLANNAAQAAASKGSILYSNIRAFASSTIDVSVFEDSERFHIPGMQGEHVAFYIKGNSMAPTIEDGDMVICKLVEPNEPIHENEIYAIITSNSVVVKRVQKVYNKRNELAKFKLISDNYLEHDPFFVPSKEVRRLLRVERRLTGLGL